MFIFSCHLGHLVSSPDWREILSRHLARISGQYYSYCSCHLLGSPDYRVILFMMFLSYVASSPDCRVILFLPILAVYSAHLIVGAFVLNIFSAHMLAVLAFYQFTSLQGLIVLGVWLAQLIAGSYCSLTLLNSPDCRTILSLRSSQLTWLQGQIVIDISSAWLQGHIVLDIWSAHLIAVLYCSLHMFS